jgi:predicted Ser/Thr protein kinase
MICKNCKAENPDNAVYCKECGTPVLENQKTVILDGSTRIVDDTLRFSPGEKFGERYQIIEEIGQGGMGKVFKARDNELDIIVALKMIKPQLSARPDIVSRFKRELLMAREILHEHVIRIHDLGEINGIKYISMNYIEGNSLEEILRSTGKLTVEKAIEITKQVCRALIAAHGKGIIHRDLKPQNIMIDKQGKAYVLDFGIARSLESDNVDAGTTQEGIVLGTPHFMSPEQIKGEKVDASTDIYSLGIIMYEMVTGKLPFNADSPMALLHMHLNEKPDLPSGLNPQLPQKLERIIMKCLEKKKKNRYSSVEEVIREVEQDKTIQIPPLKVKEKKEGGVGRGLLKNGLRLLVLLAVLYASISVSSLITDSKYSVEIEKLKAEYETYYKNYFPRQKDWLPAEWEVKDINGWTIYMELFPPRADKEGNPIPEELYLKDNYVRNVIDFPPLQVLEKTVNGLDYNGVEELKHIPEDYEKYYLYDRLEEAVKTSKLNAYDDFIKGRALNLAIVQKYVDMISLTARVDFMEGRYETGVNRLFNSMVFSIDLFSISSTRAEHEAALNCFNKVCRELVPLLLSRELDIDSLMPYELNCLSAFGKIDRRFAPAVCITPPVPEETIKKVRAKLGDFEKLIDAALKKFEPYPIFYKEYLGLGKKSENIFSTLDITKSDYHLYKKIFYWKHWFSINRFFYKEGIALYRGLFERIKHTRDMYDKSNIIADYFTEHVKGDNPIILNIPKAAFILNASRTLGKLVTILTAVEQYGLDSMEFLNLKGTDLFINEISGNRFDITGEGHNRSIILDENITLDLNKIDYSADHQRILKLLKDFH